MFFSVLSITLGNCKRTFLAINPGSGFQRRKRCPAHCLLSLENRNRRSGKPNVFGISTPDFQTNLSLFSTFSNREYLDVLIENVRQQKFIFILLFSSDAWRRPCNNGKLQMDNKKDMFPDEIPERAKSSSFDVPLEDEKEEYDIHPKHASV